MPVRSSVLALVLCACACSAAELTTTKGEHIKGDLVSVSAKEVVVAQDGMRVARPVGEVVKVDFREPGRIALGTSYAAVELTDGTLLNCSRWAIKRKEVELTLLAGPEVKVPLTAVANVLREAHVAGNRLDWKTRVGSKRGQDVLVRFRGGRILNLDCTFGEGSEAGDAIQFAVTIAGKEETRTPKLADIHGLIFKHALPAGAPPAACRLLDTHQDVVMVSSVALEGGNVVVSTPAGAQLTYPTNAVARLDYSKGKMEFLSDLDWVSMKGSSLHDDEGNEQPFVYRDSNMGAREGRGPISLGSVTFNKGLTLRPEVEVVYDLKGEYRTFSATAGLDDKVPTAEGAVELTIQGDGRELGKFTFSDRDARRSQAITLNVKDYQQLRLVVRSRGKLDSVKHVALGDAKISK